MIEVVAALIIEDMHVLLAQRGAHQEYPLHFENPGGKAVGTERPWETLLRELEEELGLLKTFLHVIPAPLLVYNDPARRFRVSLHEVRLLRPRVRGSIPVPREGQGVAWFTMEAMQHLKMTPASEAWKLDVLSHVMAEHRP